MTSTGYAVIEAPRGVENVPIVDIPMPGRTLTKFRIVIASPMTVGDVLVFLLVG